MNGLSLLLLLTACTGPSAKPGESTPPGDTDTGSEFNPSEPGDTDADDDGAADLDDCDDADPAIYPGAEELCDGVDQDCDGEIDEEAADAPTWYLDADLDGFAGDVVQRACEQPEGALAATADCDDYNDEVYPGAPELCDDDVVNDCDGDAATATEDCTLRGEEDVLRIGLPFLGLSEGGEVGTALSMGGDVNGDGKDDLLIGGPGTEGPDGYTGGAFVLHGPLSTNHVEYEVDGAIYGEEEGQLAGAGLALGPDMDGDGKGELLVGAPAVATWGEYSGGAAFFYGPVGGPHPLSHGDALIVSAGIGTRLGASSSMGGDVNGDDVADLLLGSDEQDTDDEGAAYLFFGPLSGVVVASSADAVLKGTSDNDRAGRALSSRGDADGDGLRDVVIGAPGSQGDGDARGVVWLALGPLSGTVVLDDADATMSGPASSGDAGLSLSFGGDIDGDGLDDLAVGSPGFGADGSGLGAAWVLTEVAGWGSRSLDEAPAVLTGIAVGDALGQGLSLEGDTNGDGLTELVVGVPRQADSEAIGAVHLWYGPVSGALSADGADYTLRGTAASDRFGYAVASEGDTDADGLAELLLGAIGAAGVSAPAGTAWQVFSEGY